MKSNSSVEMQGRDIVFHVGAKLALLKILFISFSTSLSLVIMNKSFLHCYGTERLHQE